VKFYYMELYSPQLSVETTESTKQESKKKVNSQ